MADKVLVLATELAAAVKNNDADEISGKIFSKTFPSVRWELGHAGVNWPRMEDAAGVKELIGKNVVSRLLWGFFTSHHMFMPSRFVSSFPRKAKSFELAWGHTTELLNMAATKKTTLINPTMLWSICEVMVYLVGSAHEASAKYPDVSHFSAEATIAFFEKIVKEANVSEILASGDAIDVLGGPAETAASFAAGLFAQVSIVRILVMTANYRAALLAVSTLKISTCEGVLEEASSAAAKSFQFHVGVAYLMSRRYHDAIECFRQSQGQVELYMAICAYLSGEPVEVTDYRIAEWKDEDFRTEFKRNAPRFVCAPVTEGMEENAIEESKEMQSRVFLRHVDQRRTASSLRGSFKLNKALTATKLCTLLKCDPATPLAPVVAAKMSACQMSRSEESDDALQGTLKSHAAVDFIVDGEEVRAHEREMDVVDALMKRILKLKRK
jgi:hypothetical protein